MSCYNYVLLPFKNEVKYSFLAFLRFSPGDSSKVTPTSPDDAKIKFKVEFKILVLTYKDIHGQSPSYLDQLIVSYHHPEPDALSMQVI